MGSQEVEQEAVVEAMVEQEGVGGRCSECNGRSRVLGVVSSAARALPREVQVGHAGETQETPLVLGVLWKNLKRPRKLKRHTEVGRTQLYFRRRAQCNRSPKTERPAGLGRVFVVMGDAGR